MVRIEETTGSRDVGGFGLGKSPSVKKNVTSQKKYTAKKGLVGYLPHGVFFKILWRFAVAA